MNQNQTNPPPPTPRLHVFPGEHTGLRNAVERLVVACALQNKKEAERQRTLIEVILSNIFERSK